MKKSLIVVLVVLFAAVAFAQETPKVEIFGGYAYTNVDLKKDLTGMDRQSMNGWDADVAAHLTKNFSIVGDISGAYKNQDVSTPDISGTAKLRVYNYLFGPRVSMSSGKISPFAEALFGISRVSVGGDVSGLGSASTASNNFGMAIGGGLDVSAGKNISIRVVKFDYMLTRFKNELLGVTDAQSLNNFRFATGVVFKF